MQTQSPRPGAASRTERTPAARRAFHVLRENPCPYLPDRRERKLMSVIEGADATAFYTLLSQAGFRRSHIFAYRPACSGCAACVPVRVLAARFRPSRNHRRLLSLNADLMAAERPARATEEQYEVFRRYITTRHGDGEMAQMSFADYRGMVEETNLDSRLTEYRTAEGRLIAVALNDWLDDGASAVYSFFDPDPPKRSLGTWMVLQLIETTCARGLPHVYLGYWIAESPKMAYKDRFRPLEGLGPEGWHIVAD